MAAMLLLAATACGKKESTEAETTALSTSQEAETKATETTAAETKAEETEAEAEEETEAAGFAGMPNPMVQVDDANEFENKLGITLDPSYIDAETELFIIAENTAHIAYEFNGMLGESVKFCLRGTKDEETAENLAGIYDDTLTESEVIEVSLID